MGGRQPFGAGRRPEFAALGQLAIDQPLPPSGSAQRGSRERRVRERRNFLMQISNAAPRSAVVLRRDRAARRCLSDVDWIFQFALRFCSTYGPPDVQRCNALRDHILHLPLICDFGGSRRDASCPKHPRSFAIPIGNRSLPTQHIGVRKRRVLEGAGASDFERKNSFAGPEWCAAVAETELPPQRFRRQRLFLRPPMFAHVAG